MKFCGYCGEEADSECKIVDCPMCNGRGGWSDGDGENECNMCWGHGELHEDRETMLFSRVPLCIWCNNYEQMMESIKQRLKRAEELNVWYSGEMREMGIQKKSLEGDNAAMEKQIRKMRDALGSEKTGNKVRMI